MRDTLTSPSQAGGSNTIDDPNALLSPSVKNKSTMQDRRKSENFSAIGQKSSLLNIGAENSRNSFKNSAKQNMTAPE